MEFTPSDSAAVLSEGLSLWPENNFLQSLQRWLAKTGRLTPKQHAKAVEAVEKIKARHRRWALTGRSSGGRRYVYGDMYDDNMDPDPYGQGDDPWLDCVDPDEGDR